MYNAFFFFYFMCKVVDNWLQIPSLVEPSVCIGRDSTSLVAYDEILQFLLLFSKKLYMKEHVFFLLLKSPPKVYKQQNCPQKDYKKGT